jgi:hypothetical protein
MYELHHVNASQQRVQISSRTNAYTIPASEVKGSIWGGAVRDRFLNIPPGKDHVEWSRCAFDQDVDVLLLTSHTHELGKAVRIFTWDGHARGPAVYLNTDWETPKILRLAQPLHVEKDQGFEFHCEYRNDRDQRTVPWGFEAKDEMCNMAVVFTPGESSARCAVVETSDGTIME